MSEDRAFEELQRDLEDVVARLERGDVPVDDAIALFRRGEELLPGVRGAARVRRAPDRATHEAGGKRGKRHHVVARLARSARIVYESRHGQAKH